MEASSTEEYLEHILIQSKRFKFLYKPQKLLLREFIAVVALIDIDRNHINPSDTPIHRHRLIRLEIFYDSFIVPKYRAEKGTLRPLLKDDMSNILRSDKFIAITCPILCQFIILHFNHLLEHISGRHCYFLIFLLFRYAYQKLPLSNFFQSNMHNSLAS
ncbi:MAG: hypothetical protein BWX46_00517 [Candidatus Cloacimonetes bacterium ADurb.Bin003]|nr:MAG: hypothetical protein BWX46_00517 [Candidatus Cloacimonetes bacterium ADurb.Bin003]